MNPKVKIPSKKINDFCQRNHIVSLSFFGSVLRDDFNDQSDIDILVTFEKGKEPGLLDLSRMTRELSALFPGRRIDLRTPSELSRYFRKEVLAHASIQYEQG